MTPKLNSHARDTKASYASATHGAAAHPTTLSGKQSATKKVVKNQRNDLLSNNTLQAQYLKASNYGSHRS
jgi:hypothetical protein